MDVNVIGILFEKPDAMRDGMKAFGGSQGTFNGENFVTVASVGHIYGYDTDMTKQVPAHLKEKYKSWDLANLPWEWQDLLWKRTCTKPDVAKRLKATLSKCDEIVIATDYDVTGEGGLIAGEILIELGLTHKKISRMIFFDEAPTTLQNAFINRKPVPSIETFDEYVQAETRARTDFLTMQWVRASYALTGNVLREGRLKGFITYLTVSQTRARNEYVKQVRYENRFKDENGVVYKKKDAPIYDTQQQALMNQTLKESAVVFDKAETRTSAPPKLINLASLGGILAKYNYAPADVKNTYQKMYQAHYVSYPRTGDDTITTEQFKQLLPHLDTIANLVGVDTSLITVRTPRSTHVKDKAGHGANRPGDRIPSSMDEIRTQYGELGVQIYTTLAKSYLAMCGSDYVYERQTGHLAQDESYVGSVNIPKDLGFKKILDWDNEADEASLGIGTHATAILGEVVNPKPSAPTIKWVTDQLKKYNVGTGSTQLSTIEALVAPVKKSSAVKQLFKQGKGGLLIPTEWGEMAYDLFRGTQIETVKVTSDLIEHMEKVKNGEAKGETMWDSVKPMLLSDIEIMKANAEKLQKEGKITMSEKFEKKEKVSGVFAPTGETVSFNAKWSTHEFTEDEKQRLLNGETLRLELPSSKGGTYKVDLHLGKGSYEGKTYFGVQSEFVNSVPAVFCKHTFTPDERTALENGEKIFVTGLIGKKGTPFDAFITFNDNDGLKLDFN